jgi:hypothetical protein
MKAAYDYPSIDARLAREGLLARGGFRVGADDPDVPNLTTGGRPEAVVMVGNAGHGMWRQFIQSPEYGERQPHALDRWSARVLGRAARDIGCETRFPFDGPPYLPFLTWAKRAEPVFSSPLGMLIHPDYGLWHAYRGALLFRIAPAGLPKFVPRSHPCESCQDRPCLSACPVNAFRGSDRGPIALADYNVASCKNHVAAPEGRSCLTGGCLARRACPVGRGYSYEAPQAEFHMRAFIGPRVREFGTSSRRVRNEKSGGP